MAKREITISEMRKELKDMGYKARIKTGAEFSMVTVLKDGNKINGANIITPEFLDEHKAFFDWKGSVSVVENGWRAIL